MAILSIPTEKTFKGPWLLDAKDLKESDEVLKVADLKVAESFEMQVEQWVAESKKLEK